MTDSCLPTTPFLNTHLLLPLLTPPSLPPNRSSHPPTIRFFDVDKDGYIDRLDCEATLKSMGLDCSPEKAEQLMDVCLANRDAKRNKVRPVGGVASWGGE